MRKKIKSSNLKGRKNGLKSWYGPKSKKNTLSKFKDGDRWNNTQEKVRYYTWRSVVFELNKRKKGLSKFYVCEKCGKKRKTTRVLHAHHIKSWDKFPKDRYDRNNGVVLCKYCHDQFHNKYKKEALIKPELLWEYLKKQK